MEANRAQAMQAFYAFAARRIARRSVPGKRWYRNAALKTQIAAALNKAFPVRSAVAQPLSPIGLTGKRLESGRKGRRRSLLFERANPRPFKQNHS